MTKDRTTHNNIIMRNYTPFLTLSPQVISKLGQQWLRDPIRELITMVGTLLIFDTQLGLARTSNTLDVPW